MNTRINIDNEAKKRESCFQKKQAEEIKKCVNDQIFQFCYTFFVY